jgi:23S rRNA pseudouridine2605 synthase
MNKNLNKSVKSGDKLQKFLAQMGLGSRREIEKKILQGRVSLNGKIASIGTKGSINDRIIFDGKTLKNQVKPSSRSRIIIYNKPNGEICTKSDPKNRKTVFSSIPLLNKGRWVSVGRLDVNTTGLLLFTNDGELANRLMHPSYEIEREYAVRVFGKITNEALVKIKNGIELKDGLAKLNTMEFSGGDNRNKWYHVTLSQGRNREIRRIFEAVNLTVSRLIRISYGQVNLPRYLSRGKFEELQYDIVNNVRQSVGLSSCSFSDKKVNKINKRI